MANEFEDTEIAGVLSVYGASLARVVAAMRGADASDSGVMSETGDATSTRLKVVAQGTPDMTVAISAGDAIVSGQLVGVLSDTNSATFTAPVGNPRIDIVQISNVGVVSVKAGTPAGSPAAPSVDANNLKLCEIYLRTAGTSIKNSDDSTNNYITDARVFI